MMLLAILVLSSLGSLFAQSNIANYTFAKTTETYTPITGGDTFIAANVPFDQEISGPITIPAFTFGGVSLTKVFIHANGYITFDSTLSTTNYTPLSSTSNNVKGVISAFSADLGMTSSNLTPGATSEIKYKQIGSEFVAQFTDVKRWVSTNERISFQIRINSATGVIKIIYGGPIVIGSSTSSLQVGIRGNNTTWSDNVSNLTINNLPSGTTCNWMDAVTGNANNSSMYLSTENSNVVPVANMAYTWTPSTSPAPIRTFGAVASITANTAIISWKAPTGATQYNVQYRIPGTCAWTSFSGNPVTDTTATLTGLLQATTYQVRVQSINTANSAIWSHIPNAAGTGNGYAAAGTFTTLTSCGIPASVAIPSVSIGSTTATANWTAPSVGPPTNYFWEVRTSGAAGSGATGLAASGTSATPTVSLTGLNSATPYTFYVRTNCSGTNSLWASGVAFTTLCTTPAPGATVASVSSNLCLGTPVNFSVATPTPGPGVTYQWQSSADNITYTNIAGATSATYSGTPGTIYYRNKVRCAAGPDSVTSVPVQLSFNNSITNTAPGTRCGLGTATLGATGSTGSTVRWYAAVAGGTSLASGTSFTTPVINTTTNFYAGAESITAGIATVGAGAITGTNYDAVFYHLYGGCNSQFLIKASELLANGINPGNITSIALNMSTVTNASYAGFAISIGTTSNADMSGGLFAGALTPAFSAASYTPTTGINTFPLTTPLNWDGVSNIVIKFCWSNNNTGGTSNYAKIDNTGFTSCAYFRADNQTDAAICGAATGSGTTSNRPQFLINGQIICSSPRIAVTATVTPPPAFAITANQTICNGAVTPLTVTSTAANYNNYTWTPVANLFTDAAATTAYTAGTNASTVYYKNTVVGSNAFTANANNTTSQCATLTTDTIITLPAAVTAVVLPASVCVTGSTAVSLIPAANYGAAGFQWQSSGDNNTFTNVAANGTGSVYTTPVITTTTYYRAILKNSSGVTCSNSASDTARVYNPLVTGTTPGAHCGPGAVTLGAAGNDGTLKWYSTAAGGISIGSGASFITPSIAATTTYYVASEVAPNGNFTIGTGTTLTSSTGYPTAFGNRWYQDWSQMVYTAAELNAAGVGAGYISGIKMNIDAIGSSATVGNYTISLGSTTNTTLSNFTTAVTSAYGPASYTSATGANTITFTTPYYWDGTSNLILDIRGKGINSTYNATTSYTATTGNTVVWAYSSSDNASYYTSSPTANTSTSRLNVTFNQNGCVSPRTPVVATINTIPVAAISPSTTVTICQGDTTTLTASGSTNYQWLNSAENINGQTNSTFKTGTAGTYSAVVISNAGCADTSVEVVINTNVRPVINLGNDTVFCSGPSLVLNAQNPGSTYLWDNFSGNQTRAVNTTGTYYVKVTNSSNCSAYDTIMVTVNPTPVVDLGNDTNLCVGSAYTLNAGNAGAAYLWDNATTAQTRTVTNTGNYFVKVTNSFNCATTDSVFANYLAYPVVNLGNDIDACASDPVVLNASIPSATSYLWDNNTTQSTRSVNATGTYYVTVGNIANCKSTDTVHVTVHPNPVVNIGNDTLICHDITLTLDAQNIGATYLWDNGTTERTRNINGAGTYQVTVTNNNSCKTTDVIHVSVTPFPTADINAVHGDTATYSFNLLNMQHVTGYNWNFGDGSPIAVGTFVQHRYGSNGTYIVSVLMAGMCDDTATSTRTVEVYDAPGTTSIHNIEANKELRLYPNPATDNVLIENITNYNLKEIAVYNVIGQKVYDQKADSKSKHNIDVSKFVSGIYTVRIETTEGTAVRKFEVLK